MNQQDADDLEPFEDHSARESALQDADDADPGAVEKPAFDPAAFDDSPHEQERRNEERGNRGPDEEPGFGQGA